MDSSTWDQRYEGSDLVWSAEPNIFLPPLIEGVAPGSALDVACGEGRNAIWLAQQGWDVTAFDFSAVGIDKAREHAGDTHVEWIVADATSFEPTKKFDLVVIFYFHLPTVPFTQAFTHAVDALAPGGTLFAVGHALSNIEDGVGGPPYPEILWTVDGIAPLLAGLDVIELEERERYVESVDATAIDLVVEDNSRIGVCYFMMSDDNVRKKVAQPWVSFGSDEEASATEGVFLESNNHPRAFGTFARVLGKYSRDEGVVALEEAVRRMTSFPAENIGIRDRGRLAEGFFADIVVFDPASVQDHATFEDPHHYATGVHHVFVNGEQVVANGEHTGATPGRVVRGPGWTGWQADSAGR